MKFNINRLEFLRIVSFAAAVVPSRAMLPALSNVKLEASKAGLSATGSDNEIWATSKCEADVSVDGCLGLPAKLLKDFLGSVLGDTVSFEKKGTRVLTLCGSAKAELPFISGEEFPEFAKIKGEAIELSGAELKAKLSQVSFAAFHEDASRPAISGVCFEFKDNLLNLVATNGRMLALASIDTKGSGLYVVPNKFISALIALLTEEDATCTFADNAARFESASFSLQGRLIDANFPNYQQVIPNDGQPLSVNREEFLSLVKRASVFTTEKFSSVKVRTKKKLLEVSSGAGEQSFEDSISFEGAEFNSAFDPTYLSVSVSAAKSDMLDLRIIDELSPLKIVDKDYVAVLMPMRMS